MRSDRKYRPDATLHPLPGDHSVVAPPVPIPNTEVKRNRADGSVILSCKSRSSPGSLPYRPSVERRRALFCPGICGGGGRRPRTATGHRQGLYPEPQPIRLGFFYWIRRLDAVIGIMLLCGDLCAKYAQNGRFYLISRNS